MTETEAPLEGHKYGGRGKGKVQSNQEKKREEVREIIRWTLLSLQNLVTRLDVSPTVP